jgi:hypothetical protein
MPLQATSGAASYDAFGGGALAVAPQAEAIDYDGTNDFLSRSTDLVGNTDGKTFTFSAWVWVNATGATQYLWSDHDGVNQGLAIFLNTSNQLRIFALTSAGATALSATVTTPLSLTNTFCNVLISIDLANSANRSVYVNDVQSTVTWTTYTNSNIAFAKTGHQVAATTGGSGLFGGRISNVFLDYTYRDMSVTANRRLFVTADLKPAAGQAALNPIMYLTMGNPTAPGTNSGTGGNFTLTGVVARSGRGPNQYNAPYSDLDGAADYLSRTTAPTGIADGKQFTLAFCFSTDDISNGTYIAFFGTGNTERFFMQFNNGTARLGIVARNSANATILNALTDNNSIVANRNYVVTISMDLSDAAKRYVYINGQQASVTWTTYTNDNIQFNITSTPRYGIGAQSNLPTGLLNGKLGALWFNTSYIDLSVPANLAKFVTGTGINAAPVDLGATGELPTGTSPLIYLPMYGNNAGRNYGTGGDFTVNSGPYTGARGPNEFWGNRAAFDGSTGYLRTSNTTGAANSKQASGSFWIRFNAIPTGNQFPIYGATAAGGSRGVRVTLNTTPNLRFLGTDTSGSNVLDVTCAFTLAANTDYYIQFCFDLADSAKRFVYINGVNRTLTVTTYTNTDIAHSEMTPMFGAGPSGPSSATGFFNGSLAEAYLVTSYIDFSQEANRLLFRDAFGNPTNLPSAITAGTVANPPVYMRFDPSAQGTNSGTGGNLTKFGTITDGGQL